MQGETLNLVNNEHDKPAGIENTFLRPPIDDGFTVSVDILESFKVDVNLLTLTEGDTDSVVVAAGADVEVLLITGVGIATPPPFVSLGFLFSYLSPPT